MSRPLLALDADGVLVDLHVGYARAWQRAFGVLPAERDPLADWPMDRFDVAPLEPEQRLVLRAQFQQQAMWEDLPAIDGALQACHRLHDAGYELVCVTALEQRFQAARLRNLKRLGSRSAATACPTVPDTVACMVRRDAALANRFAVQVN